MYKGNITSAYAYTTGNNLPLNLVWNTNNNTAYDSTNNQVVINTPGYYDISASFSVTQVPVGEFSMQLYADGISKTEATSTETAEAVTDAKTLTIVDTVFVEPKAGITKATIGIRFSESLTVNNGVLTVERRK